MATVLVILGIAAGIVLLILCFCVFFKMLGPKICCKIMCCPLKMMVKCCRCCCKTLPEWCHACADESRKEDREIIMLHERRMMRLEENRRPDTRVIPTNRVKGTVREEHCEEVEPNQTRVRQKKKFQLHKNAGEHLCFCGCGSEGADFHRAALNELLACTERDPVYFNIPGLKVEQAKKLIMKPNVAFSLAGVLTTMVPDEQYLFKIPRGLSTQHRAWQHGRFEELPCSKRKELHSTYFSAMLPCNVAMWFVSKTPQYNCINTPKD